MDPEPVSLSTIPLFRALAPRRRQALTAQAAVETYRRGQTLFVQGAPAQHVWLVVNGWVHLVRAPAPDHSHPVVIFTVTPKEVLCGVSALELQTYSASGVAGSEATVLRIPAVAFRELLTRDAAFAYDVLCLCAERIRHLAERCGEMAEPVTARIIRTLLQLRRQFGATLPVTHRELSQMSWTTTESAIRVVRGLKRRGYVTGRRGQLTIARAAALRKLLQPSGVGNGRAA